MAPMNASRLAEYRETDLRVTSFSTIRVMHNTYSVPSRLNKERVRVRVYESKIEVWYAGKSQFQTERLKGRFGHHIDYRHIIWSLVRKPGAFARYRYRADLFPSLVFRKTHDAIHEEHPDVRGDLEYLRILHLAAATSESEVEIALECLLEAGQTPTSAAVRSLVVIDNAPTEAPDMEVFKPDLDEYDQLLDGELLSAKEIAS